MRKISLIALFFTMVILLSGCNNVADKKQMQTDLETYTRPSAPETGEKIAATETVDETQVESDITFDELWSVLDGTWIFEEYEHMGKVANYRAHSMEFHYVDGKPCMSQHFEEYDGHYPDTIFYDCSAQDESHYIAYTYKKGSYGGDWENWSSDVLSVWYSFDLSNLPDGELLLGFHMAWDNGFIDNNHLYRYSQN